MKTVLVALAICILTSTTDAQMIVAHRGASHDAPENTLAAFRLAWEQQSDGIEGDFYLTADEEIVCIHDKNTVRTTGVSMKVEASTLEQLRKLEAGRWKDPKWTGEKLPTFEEVLATVPKDHWFVIELKSTAKIVPVLAEKIRQHANPHVRMLIISFDSATIRACKKHLPDLPAHWLTGFKRRLPRTSYQPSLELLLATFQECGADGVGMQGVPHVITSTFARQLREGGCREFHVWTVDDAEQARQFRDLGAWGITTNRPAEIRAALSSP